MKGPPLSLSGFIWNVELIWKTRGKNNLASAQQGLMTFYQVLSPLYIFFVSYSSTSFQNEHKNSGDGGKTLSRCKGPVVWVTIHLRECRQPWTGCGTPGVQSCSSLLTFSHLADVLDSA